MSASPLSLETITEEAVSMLSSLIHADKGDCTRQPELQASVLAIHPDSSVSLSLNDFSKTCLQEEMMRLAGSINEKARGRGIECVDLSELVGFKNCRKRLGGICLRAVEVQPYGGYRTIRFDVGYRVSP